MIDIKTWLRQIMLYCDFVVDDIRLRQAWIDRDFSETSVTDFDELYEQVFDDLDAERSSVELLTQLPNAERIRTVIADFLTSLQQVDRARSKTPELLNASNLLASGQWQQVRSAALAALSVVDHKADDS